MDGDHPRQRDRGRTWRAAAREHSLRPFAVGVGEVTRIEKTANIRGFPYVRVWCGGRVHSEHCQHALAGVYFKPFDQEIR